MSIYSVVTILRAIRVCTLRKGNIMKIIASAFVMIVSASIAITSFFIPWFTKDCFCGGNYTDFIYPLDYSGYAMAIAPLFTIVMGSLSILWYFQLIPRGTITWVRTGSFIASGMTLTSLIVFGYGINDMITNYYADLNRPYVIPYHYAPYFLGLLGMTVSTMVNAISSNKGALLFSKPQKLTVESGS